MKAVAPWRIAFGDIGMAPVRERARQIDKQSVAANGDGKISVEEIDAYVALCEVDPSNCIGIDSTNPHAVKQHLDVSMRLLRRETAKAADAGVQGIVEGMGTFAMTVAAAAIFTAAMVGYEIIGKSPLENVRK